MQLKNKKYPSLEVAVLPKENLTIISYNAVVELGTCIRKNLIKVSKKEQTKQLAKAEKGLKKVEKALNTYYYNVKALYLKNTKPMTEKEYAKLTHLRVHPVKGGTLTELHKRTI